MRSKLSKDIIGALLDPSKPDPVPWYVNDLRAILEHQLATRLTQELDGLAEFSGYSVGDASTIIQVSGCLTFIDLLQANLPSSHALLMFKNYAKGSLTKGGGLPTEVARVLYVSTITRAKQCGFHDISTLDDASIEREARRCLTFNWLPDSIRSLLNKTLNNP